MYCVKKMTEDLYWVGGNDRRLALFENVYPIPRGVSYNAYVVLDEKTVLLDTVDNSVSPIFFENLAHVLNGRKLDYLIVNHMEPDHAATIEAVVLRYPEVRLVCNKKTAQMMKNFFSFDVDSRVHLVAEMDTLCTGKHTFAFVMAPMVHWPEVMVTYDVTTKTLFAADAFGTFGALGGNLYADEVNFQTEWLDDARRYYTNIVGKYGTQVQALLKKAATIEIETICPLHGPVWRKDIGWFIDKYVHWATYTPEEDAVVIAYASVYGNTETAANILAGKLADLGVRNVKVYDVSATHASEIVSECFRTTVAIPQISAATASAHTTSVMICCRFLLFRRSSRIPLLPFEQYRANYSTFFPIRQVCRLFRISLRISRIWCIIVQNRRSISGFPRKTGFFLHLTVTTFRTS